MTGVGAIPPHLMQSMVVGTTGKVQLLALADEALGLAGQAGPAQTRMLVELARDFLLAAWDANPFDGLLAHQLLALHEKIPCVDPGAVKLLTLVADNWREPPPPDRFRQLPPDCEATGRRAAILERLGREKDNLYWWDQVWVEAWEDGDAAWAASVLPLKAAGPLEELFTKVRADLALSWGDPERAHYLYGLVRQPYSPNLLFRQGFCRAAAGGRDQALPLLRGALERFPWHVNYVLQAYDALTGRQGARSPLPGKVAVALYSYNKRTELEATLASLRASQLEGASIFVLNNGSTDGTGAMLERWRETFGAGGVNIITLPINIGAPAARNWLMHLKEVQDHQFVAFMDDDLELPPDWLSRLGAAREAYPEAGVWGCQVVDYQRPEVLQSVDLHLVRADETEALPEAGGVQHFKTSSLHYQDFNLGQFQYLRPCASVTGCCHLFETETLVTTGVFDLACSPSQFDDVDHDLRRAIRGKPAVYQGHLTIGHKKKTGKQSESRTTPETESHLYLLQKRYDRETMARVMAWERQLLQDDLLQKMADMQRELDLTLI